jgi:hypothetical protein
LYSLNPSYFIGRIFSIDFFPWSDESPSGERKKIRKTSESSHPIFKENSFELQPRQINIREAGAGTGGHSAAFS